MATGKGSMQQRDKDGYTWQLTISAGYKKDGKKNRHLKTVHVEGRTFDARRKAAERELSLFLAATERNDYIEPSKRTLEDFVNKWLEDYAQVNLQPKTLYRYKEMLDKRIIPALGNIKLEKLQPTQLLDFYNNLTEEGIRLDTKYIATPKLEDTIKNKAMDINKLAEASGISDRTINNALKGLSISRKSAESISKALNVKLTFVFSQYGEPGALSQRTVLHHHRLISSILTCAVQWQLLLSNPCERIKPPKVEKSEARHYDEEYAIYVLELLDKYKVPIKYKVAIHIAINAGLRLGELVGLEWSSVDFDNRLIQIKQAGQYLPDQGVFTKETKNESSFRKIPLPDDVMDLLKQYKSLQNEQRLKCGSLWVDSNRLFTQWDGKPMFPDTPSKWFRKFINKHNETIMNDKDIPQDDKKKYLLPELNFHGLRHTNATLLIGEGVDIQTVSGRLGHARASTTTDIYGHYLKNKNREAADKLQTLFSKKKGTINKQA